MDAQVLIVGAGPAGAALALRLARQGRDVLILERSRFPRDKPCGDCLNPGALRELDRLGLVERFAEELRPVPLEGWEVEAPDGVSFAARFVERGQGRAAVGWAVRRRDFDAALLAAARSAGARVEFGVRVLDVIRANGRVWGVVGRRGVRIDGWHAQVIVGADGLRSVLRDRLALRARPAGPRKIALVAHLTQAEADQTPGQLGAFGELRVRGGRVCGYAPLSSGANITLVVPGREARAISGDARAFLLEGMSEFPVVQNRIRRSTLELRVRVTGPFDHPVRRPWVPGALLVGDAAGYYDPFTGQGIHQALRSAKLAADAIGRLIVRPRTEVGVLRRYGRRMRYEFAPKRVVQRTIERIIARPRTMSCFVQALSGGEGAAATRLLGVTGDMEHPVALIDPRLWIDLMKGWQPRGK